MVVSQIEWAPLPVLVGINKQRDIFVVHAQTVSIIHVVTYHETPRKN